MTDHMYNKTATVAQEKAVPWMTANTTGSDTEEKAMILIGTNNTLLSVNAAAERLLGLPAYHLKGQPVSILGEGMSLLAQHPTRPGSSNILQLSNGKTVLAHTRTVVGRNQQPMGRVINFQDISSTLRSSQRKDQDMMPTIGTLQAQIKNMQELIEMVPTFSNNRHWQNLLIEHMQRLVEEMNAQVQQLSPVSPSA